MAKHKKAEQAQPDAEHVAQKISRKHYDKELERLHVELVKLQQWVVAKGLKVVVVFEGRDGAGKGGTIKAITERVSPRVLWTFAPTSRRANFCRACRCLSGPSSTRGSSSSSTGWKSARKNKLDAWKAASTMAAKSGS